MKKAFVFLALLSLLYSCSKKDGSGPQDEPIYHENFDEGESTGFWIGSRKEDSLTASLAGGYYQVSDEGVRLRILTLSPVFIVDTGNAAIETRVAVTPVDGNTESYAGIVWGFDPSTRQSFTFGCYTDGYYDIWGYPNGNGYKQIKEPEKNAAVQKNGFNTLRIEEKGNTLHFLINGKEVYSMKSNVPSLDQPGLMVDGKTKAKFDYFKAEAIP